MDLVKITPLDVLYLRGNRLFAQASNAEAQMPPWPSLFAGALRSRMLVDAGENAIERFGKGELDGNLQAVLGSSPSQLGSFRIVCTGLLQEDSDARQRFVVPLPADLTVRSSDEVLRSLPANVRELGLSGSFALSKAPVLRAGGPAKPRRNVWLTGVGVQEWQRGHVPTAKAVVSSSELWNTDPRLGIAMDSNARSAKEGMLYTTDCVALRPNVSFLVGVRGANGLLPKDGLLRLGGDGRAASIETVEPAELGKQPWSFLPKGKRFTMALTTPMISPSGWLPPGASSSGNWRLASLGLHLRIVAAAIGRHEVVSGWDIVKHRPKPALRVVPTGSVYWLELIEGDAKALESLRDNGLGALLPEGERDKAREAEGFGNVWFGEWPQESPVA